MGQRISFVGRGASSIFVTVVEIEIVYKVLSLAMKEALACVCKKEIMLV